MFSALPNSIALLLFAVLPPVEVAETQQPAYAAQLVSVSGQGVTVEQAGKVREIPLDNLLRLTLKNNPAEAVTDPLPIAVTLRDGSQIGGTQVGSDATTLTISGIGNQSVKIGTKQVSSCLLRPLSPQLLKQWQALIESRATSDLIVLARSEEALDKIEGVVSKITPEAVSFEFDGQSIDAPRTKIAGVKFFSPDVPLTGKLAAVVRDIHENRWITSSIEVSNQGTTCKLNLQCGATVELPLSDIREFDFSYGNMRYLAEIEPLERTSAPGLDFGSSLPDAAKLFGPRSIKAATASSLTGPSLEFIGAGSITFRIPQGFSKLVGSVELDPDGHRFTPCRAAILLDNKILWEHVFEATRKPQPLSVAIEPDKRLRLVVESKSEHPVGDIVRWNQLRFAK